MCPVDKHVQLFLTRCKQTPHSPPLPYPPPLPHLGTHAATPHPRLLRHPLPLPYTHCTAPPPYPSPMLHPHPRHPPKPRHDPYHIHQVGLYELWTEEYVQGLAQYLRQLLLDCAPVSGECVILDAGAGDGRLVQHLRQQLDCNPPALPNNSTLTLVAVDVAQPAAPGVEQLNFQAALRQYRPVIVLCAWMPQHQDWTGLFRRCPSMRHYILIGEMDDGCCGHPFLTWGVRAVAGHVRETGPGAAGAAGGHAPAPSSSDDRPCGTVPSHDSQPDATQCPGPVESDSHLASASASDSAAACAPEGPPRRASSSGPGPEAAGDSAVPPYVADGFSRRRLADLSELQLSRTTLVPEGVSFSHTVVFSRGQRTTEGPGVPCVGS